MVLEVRPFISIIEGWGSVGFCLGFWVSLGVFLVQAWKLYNNIWDTLYEDTEPNQLWTAWSANYCYVCFTCKVAQNSAGFKFAPCNALSKYY